MTQEADRLAGGKVDERGQTGSAMEDRSPEEMSKAPTEAYVWSQYDPTHTHTHHCSDDGDLKNLKG